jgi:hypothetical protein
MPLGRSCSSLSGEKKWGGDAHQRWGAAAGQRHSQPATVGCWLGALLVPLLPPAAVLPPWLALAQQQNWPPCRPVRCAGALAAVGFSARCRLGRLRLLACSPRLRFARQSLQLPLLTVAAPPLASLSSSRLTLQNTRLCRDAEWMPDALKKSGSPGRSLSEDSEDSDDSRSTTSGDAGRSAPAAQRAQHSCQSVACERLARSSNGVGPGMMHGVQSGTGHSLLLLRMARRHDDIST